jgi:predicted RecB family nuclease
VGETGSLVVYSNYEAGVLRRLARFDPARSEAIDEVIHRLSDLLAILRRFYYHPAFNGSYSIKRVLPALAPDLDYGDLEIRDGATAAARQFRLMDPGTPSGEQDSIRQALLLYCERDTLAMVAIRRAILARCGEVQPPLRPVEE